jgi:hypothetical protein
LRYSYDLKFAETPNYEKLRFLLKKILLDIGQVPVDYFCWKKNASHLKDDIRFDGASNSIFINSEELS